MNPMNFLALKPSWEKFRTNHPKMISFVKTASRESFLDEGSLIEIKVTNSSGKTMAANIRVKKAYFLIFFLTFFYILMKCIYSLIFIW